ncbi:alkene reductase [Streptomyces roseochromogenus]|uniref:NADH:flavin oxidoreductase/NADH oxidase N-terminal domain-containing protein n=1 Tax=Streptomyces roseochromogenus subsp. oscitans DS 12.976 TaxID=1352936 RepID=V6JEY0_STRRC|nr:alkene reductase [Streptomyces roseochromogenus]EST18467.1 hypothetical protein M878_44935 [Streptomyces roseochromogenus subsp. oscitans DS 12.976]
MTTAFDPIDLGGLRLANRIAMAPLTRSRAYGPGASPTPSMATYYAQRAGAGLIISEATQPSLVGRGYPDTPGLYSAGQVQAWLQVTEAVHREGGVIFAQLQHVGRIGDPGLLPDGLRFLAPSPIAAAGQVYTAHGLRDLVTPVEMTEADIAQTIADFAHAARNAIAAGFDGVELHGANGYLLHQFLATNANQRTDGWGGSVEGRIRFTVEVTRAVADAIGAHRTGLRISPNNPNYDITEDGYHDTYQALVEAIEPIGPAYLHVLEERDIRDLTLQLRKHFSGTFILNPHTPGRPTGVPELALIEDGTADLIAYGAQFIANPDLPARLAVGGPFNTPERATYYGGDERGYTDYPTLTD